MHPTGRMGQPKEITETACALLADMASFMSGLHSVVDAGLLGVEPGAGQTVTVVRLRHP